MAALGGAAVFRLVFGATAQFRFDDFTIRATSLDAEGSTLQVRVWDSEFRRKVFIRRKAQTKKTFVAPSSIFFCFVVGALLVVFPGLVVWHLWICWLHILGLVPRVFQLRC